jgi:putative ABC transport system ATP-binding protein
MAALASNKLASGELLVQLKGIGKSYKKGKEQVSVLANLSLDIHRGDFLALMGPSGSGKTTLLNLLGGLDKPSSGELVIGGQRLDQMSSSQLTKWRARHVGFIFQFYNLMPVLTAEKNVELPLLLTNLSSKQRKHHVTAALELVGLSNRAKHYPSELSGGQEQRVAIARALVSDPDLLLCDEPTGDLDRATADEILSLLQQLNQLQQKTIVMVTHDPRAAEHARHTWHMDKGSLVTNAQSVNSGRD